jgi:hypothetical protein
MAPAAAADAWCCDRLPPRHATRDRSTPLGDPQRVDWALGHAAVSGRFGEGDLASILAHHAPAGTTLGREDRR